MMVFTPLTSAEIAQIKATLGRLPISGSAWPKWVKGAAIAMLVLIVVQYVLTVDRVGIEQLKNLGGMTMLIVFMALVVMTYFMSISTTTISDQGIKQSWITKREVSWEEITFAKFVPMLASKRLMVFVKKGRPVIFQGADQELQVAFAHISLQFKQRQL